MMIVSGHQPAYLPWLGYFHKLSLCDAFVYMDTVQYLENDWNNRNKIRTPEGWMWLTVPVDRKKTQGKMLDDIVIRGHEMPDSKDYWATSHWKSIESNYLKTPYFKQYRDELHALYFSKPWVRLIDLCWAQLLLFAKWLELDTKKIVRMSEISFEGKKSDLILDHCKKMGGNAVVFGTHGRDYVDKKTFKDAGIKLYFQNYQSPTYQQRFQGFESGMCILDLLFNCGNDSLAVLTSNNVTYEELKNGNHWE